MISLVDTWIREHVPGGSFADVGGLFKTYGEKVTTAHKHGASSVCMVDVQKEGGRLWKAFQEYAEKQGVDDCECIVADATRAKFADKVGKHDFAHCSGVIYHVPDPVGLLLNLKAITNKYLVIKSVVIPEVIQGQSDKLTLDTGALFVPALGEKQKRILAEYFRNINIKVHGINGREIPSWLGENGKPRTGPWWWLWTPEYLGSLLKTVELEIISEGYINAPRSYAFLCRVGVE